MTQTPVSPNAVYNARPTIEVDGRVSDMVAYETLYMEMREQETGMASLELRLVNFDTFLGFLGGLVFDNEKTLKLGAAIKVYAGDRTSPTEIFRGKVTAIEARYPRDGWPELVVLAEDALQGARMQRRTRTWDAGPLSDIVTQIARQLGLTPMPSGLAESVGTEQQFNESDLYFLRRLLARYDADLQVVEDELHAYSRGQAQRNAIQLNMNGKLREVRVLADLAHQVTSVTATGWDYKQGQTIAVASQAVSFGPGTGNTGKEWLTDAFMERSEQLGQFSNMNQAEAQARVDAEFVQRMRRFVVAHGVTEGDPQLRVGSWLTLAGLGRRFSNTYYTTAAVHRFDTENGYETEFTAECAYLGAAA